MNVFLPKSFQTKILNQLNNNTCLFCYTNRKKLIENELAFANFVSSAPNGYVFQPNLESDGFEYTSGIFGDGLGGFSASITLRRRLATGGYTEYAEAVNEPSIYEKR
jgi:hypothetical protein